MKCPDKGVFQAYIDKELDDILNKRIENHILKCKKCEITLRHAINLNCDVSAKISEYSSLYNDNDVYSATPSLNTNIHQSNSKKGENNNMKKYIKYISAACLVIVISTCFTYQPIRAKVSDALSIFRAKDVKELDISLNDIQQIQNQLKETGKDINIEKFGKINTTGGEKKWLEAKDVSEIKDFKVLMPSDKTLGTPGVYAFQPTKTDLSLNISNVNKMMTSLGAKKLFPEEVNGKTFSIKIPTVLQIEYTKGTKTINILETSSPEIIVPDGVDADQLYAALTDLPILPDTLKQKLKSINDWKQTVYVPVVENQTEVITLNNGKGYMVNLNQTGGNASGKKGIMWYSENTFYYITGDLSKSELIDLANSMR